MLAFMAGFPLLGIKIAYQHNNYVPLLLGALAFTNAVQLYANRSRAAGLWLCVWVLFDAGHINEWQFLILTPLSFTSLRLANWRNPQPLHPILWIANLYFLILLSGLHPH